jgi:hypothetical protein
MISLRLGVVEKSSRIGDADAAVGASEWFLATTTSVPSSLSSACSSSGLTDFDLVRNTMVVNNPVMSELSAQSSSNNLPGDIIYR